MREGEERGKEELKVVAGVERGSKKKKVTEEKSKIANELKVVARIEREGGKKEVTEKASEIAIELIKS